VSHMEALGRAEVAGPTLDRRNAQRSRRADEPPDILYHRDDVLLLPVADLAQLGELNAALAAACPGAALEPETTAGAADRPGFTPRFARLGLVPPEHADRILGLLREVLDGELAGVASRLRLEHVAFPSIAIFGEPGSKGHGAPDREPVVVLSAPPARRTLAELRCGRRPVVAMLDTGVVLPHPWFPPADPAPGGDAFVLEPEDWMASPVSRVPKPESPSTVDLHPLSTHAGHGTFIAGLIRQLAPDAHVLSMPVMHADDGAVYEHLLLNALEYLCGRAESGDPERFVDVVSLSLGYREQATEDCRYTDELRALLRRLGRRGVQVVASAGNRGDDEKTYPAAIAAEAPPEHRRVHSVGALNPNGTPARYSCHGKWVTDRQVGTRLISSFPPYNGDALPESPRSWRPDPGDAEGLDPDDYTGGYASWSGTSFAAAVLSGRLARALIPDPAQAGADGALLDVRPAAANDRADRAYAAVLHQ
jgi:Subtilase family